MEGVLSKIFAIFLGCIIMFVAPVFLMNERKKNIVQSYVLSETIEFVDEVCNKGIIYENEYLEFLNNMSISDEVFRVEMENYTRIVDEEGSYYKGNFNNSILASIEQNRSYPMKKGDILKVKIYNHEGNLLAFYGGCIKDEDY